VSDVRSEGLEAQKSLIKAAQARLDASLQVRRSLGCEGPWAIH